MLPRAVPKRPTCRAPHRVLMETARSLPVTGSYILDPVSELADAAQ
jgi:hypothetical protein